MICMLFYILRMIKVQSNEKSKRVAGWADNSRLTSVLKSHLEF